MDNDRSLLRLYDIVFSVFSGKWIVVALTIVGIFTGMLVSSVGYVRGEMSKQYRIEASVLVSSQLKNGSFASSSANPNKDDISLAKDLTDQAIYIMQSDKTITTTIEKLGMVGVSAKSIRNNLTLTQYNSSQIIEISFLWRSKDEGIQILKMLEQTSRDIMLNTLMIGNVVSVNEPKATYMFGGQFNITTWFYCALAGLLIGVGICIIRRLRRPTLIRSEDITEYYGMEVLGDISEEPRFALSNPFCIVPETSDVQVSTASYVILDRIDRAGVKSLYVTSAVRNEGKSTLLADWAVKISETGKKVLLVDCDFNNPSLAPLFRVKLRYENSLNALYNADCDKNDAIIRLSGGLHLLSYVLEDKPDPLSIPMLDVIKNVARDYDLVLFDAPGIVENAEVLRLNTVADAAVFVARHDTATLSDIDVALTRLRKSEIPLIGAVVNGSRNLRSVLLESKGKHANTLRKLVNRSKRRY